MKKLIAFIITIMTVLLFSSCVQDVAKHDVYVTVYPLKYITEELFKDTDYTVGIVPGATSHENSAEWAPKQIIAMKEAQLLFYVGGNYDQYIDKKLNVFDSADVKVIKVEDQTEFIQYIPGEIHSHEHEDGEEHTETTGDKTSLGTDPHFWISPKRMLDALELFFHHLKIEFPNDTDLLESNYLKLKTKLEELHIDYMEAIASMNKPALTSTNLYGYLREDYNLVFIPIASGYHEEPDEILPSDAKKIMDEIAYHSISKIIYEKKRSSPASDNIFAQMQNIEIEAEKLQFDILQALPNEYIRDGKDYITEMLANLEIFKKAGR